MIGLVFEVSKDRLIKKWKQTNKNKNILTLQNKTKIKNKNEN